MFTALVPGTESVTFSPLTAEVPLSLSRSEQMSRIRGKHTRPEEILRDALVESGLEPELQLRIEGMRPDLVLKVQRVAVFVDGCFWHGCPRHYVRPRNRHDFWAAKLRENVERDRNQMVCLERAGWRVVRVWEHSVFENLHKSVAAIREVSTGQRAQAADERRVIRVDELGDPWQERRLIVALRDPTTVVAEHEGRRITTKWRRPRDGDRGNR